MKYFFKLFKELQTGVNIALIKLANAPVSIFINYHPISLVMARFEFSIDFQTAELSAVMSSFSGIVLNSHYFLTFTIYIRFTSFHSDYLGFFFDDTHTRNSIRKKKIIVLISFIKESNNKTLSFPHFSHHISHSYMYVYY